MAEHYHGSSGAGLRQRVVEPKYVEALGVLVVSAARHRSWQPSSPNGQATSTSPPHPTSVNLSAKNLGVGRKKMPDRYEISRKAKIGFEILLGKKDGKRV